MQGGLVLFDLILDHLNHFKFFLYDFFLVVQQPALFVDLVPLLPQLFVVFLQLLRVLEILLPNLVQALDVIFNFLLLLIEQL